MKKLIPLLLLFFCCKAFSQAPVHNTTAFSLGAELNIPSYGLYNIGTGASAKFETPIISPVSLTVTGGFTSIFYRSSPVYSYNKPGADLFVPLKAGLKYYLAPTVYAEGEGGVALQLNHEQEDLFAYSIGVGFIAYSNEKSGLDFGIRYEDWQGRLKQAAIRFAYRF